MKRTLLIIACFAASAIPAFSHVGDISAGLKSGWTTGYDNLLYGIDAAYNLTGSVEITFTGLMNSNVSQKDEWDGTISKLSVYSGNLDARLYLLSTREWGLGPALGVQYFSQKSKTNNENKNINALGFNIGVHGKLKLTDNLLINGGWRYTNAKEEYPEAKYHFIYLGVAFTFQTR
ncbi:MAG: porin family protein [Dysgonamonadaceae bacterium]|jgi:hypothetical protein|nr:porin family protein [Dysgonamonadaceae bacterium]